MDLAVCLAGGGDRLRAYVFLPDGTSVDMKSLTYLGLLAGLLVLAALLAWRGVGEVGSILVSSGWFLLVLPLAWFPTLILSAAGWRALFEPGRAPPFMHALGGAWIGRAVNTLLPVAQLGGEIVRARLLALWGTDPVTSTASVVVDKTVQATATILWGLIGVFLLVMLSVEDGLAGPALGGLAVLGLAVGAFLLVQRAGMFGFFAKAARLVGKGEFWDGLVDRAGEVDGAVNATYGRPRRVAISWLWRLGSLIFQTGEVWLAAYLLGHPIGIVEALMLKSLSATMSDTAFVVPNGYGVQEGAYIILGGLIGLTPEFMLALSLATRIRDVAIDVPGLFAWQHAEGRHFFRRARAG